MLNKLLERQIKRHFGKDFQFDILDENLRNFFNDISETYMNNDKERRFLENTITVNTEELSELLRERSSLLEYKTQENQESINLLRQYKNAIDLSLIVSTTDLNGKIIYVNDNFCRVSEYSKEELIGSFHNIISDPSNDPSLFKNMWNQINNKEIWHGTFSNLKKSGEKYYVNCRVQPLLDREGNIKEFISLSEDVTQQIIYQGELKSQKERVKTILDNQENIIIIVNKDFGLVEANKRFFEMFNFEDLNDFKTQVNKIQYLFDKNRYFDENLSEFEWCKQFSKKNDFIYKISKSSDEKNQIFNVNCSEVILDKQINYVCTFSDITELENAREKAEIAQKAKSTFLANMSHEIRTPLNAIIGFSDILCDSDIKKEHKENANIISRSAKSLLNIINDVLDISKIESGKLAIVNEEFIFETFLEHIVELFAIVAKEKEIDFLYSPDNNLPFSVIGDCTRLQQVITNLLSNAIKFTPKNGEVIFSINLISTENNTTKIKFSIKDSGIGITKEQQNIIFNPFSQADNGISRKYGGTGLGLSICADIVRLMNSNIILDSKENEGSEFSFVLEFEVVKSRLSKSIFSNDIRFLFYTSNKECEIRDNIQAHIKKLGQVEEYNEINKNSDILFCSGIENLDIVLPKFKKDNPNSLIIYIGIEKNLNMQVKEYIDSYISLPLYGSKLFNTVSEKLNLNNKLIKESENEFQDFKGKILIAEDNSNNQKLMEILLSKLGIDFTIVHNGLEAVEKYINDKYDLILMDINMPVMDGITATKEIRNLENIYYKIPIIALTANSIAGDKEKYLAEGMDEYLSKPLEFNKLKSMLNKYLMHNSIIEKSENLYNLEKEKKRFINYKKEDAISQLGLNESIIDLLLNNFFLTLDNDLENLEKAIESKDQDKTAQAAHYLKGSCLNLAMNNAAEVLQDIEIRAKNGNISMNLDRLKYIFSEIKDEI